MSNETIARRYSIALADVVLRSGEAETVKAELSALGDLFAQSSDLQAVFTNPSIAHINKERVLDGLISKAKPTKTTANFLKVLLKNGRVAELQHINEKFASVLEERSGVVSAEVTSARELPADERSEFEKTLAQLTGKQVLVNYGINEDIIGGVVARIGSTVYDGSVRSKLDTLKEQLVNG